VFDVECNGVKAIADLDLLREAGAYRTVVTRTVPVTVSNGRLVVDFKPAKGDAVVSNLTITRQ
jgi:beta-galactosidase